MFLAFARQLMGQVKQKVQARKVMSLKEAEEILKGADFDKMFAANDPKNGGSFYLQSKIHNANETVKRSKNSSDK